MFEDDLLAWEHGPVVRSVYDSYSQYSANAIPVPLGAVVLTQKEQELISNVWRVYGQFSAWRLRDMTHNEAPWKNTLRNQKISHDKLSSFFKTLIVNG